MIDPRAHPIFAQTLQEWQGIVDLVAHMANVRAGLVMRVRDEDIEVFVSSRNPGNPYEVGEREKLLNSGLYCERVIATQDQLLVPNALKTDEWRNNPDIKKNMISYLGFPIRLANGRPFGTICVLDDREHEYEPDVVKLIEKMRDLIESHLRLNERVLLQENARLLEQLQGELAVRARIEVALRASEERYRLLLMLSPDGISVVEQTGRILACNEQFARMHGYERATEVIGVNAADLTRPEAFAGLYREVALALERGEKVVRDIEVEVLRRDGISFWAEYSVAPMPWPDAPSGVAYISNIRDITQRKALAAELARHRLDLEELVAARTAELRAEMTERAAAQAALQRSQAGLAEAERIADMGSWERDHITGESHWSAGLYHILGIPPGTPPEVAYAASPERVHPDDESAVQATIARALQSGEPAEYTYRIVLPSGEMRFLNGRTRMVQDAGGRTVRTYGMVQDITEQTRTRQALDERIKELSILQALSHVISFRVPLAEIVRIYLDRLVSLAELDMAQVFLLREGRLHLAGVCTGPAIPAKKTARPNHVSYFGDTSAAGDPLKTDAPPLTLAVGECLCGLAVQQGQTVYAPEIVGDPRCMLDGCHADGLHSLAALPLAGGEVTAGVLVVGAVAQDAFAGRLGFLETIADLLGARLQNLLLYQEIRERAAGLEEAVAERMVELQTERNRTQAILETVGESVIVTDLDGQMLFTNPATESLTGFSRDELLGQPIWRQWSAQARKDSWPQAQRAVSGGQPWRSEVAGQRKDGAPYVVALTGTPLYDERAAPQATGAVWVQRDITSLKEAERLKDQFVSNVSHELRTPISIIALSCDNLDAFYDRLGDAQRRRLLADIREQAHLLGNLVEDILTLSRIDSGRISLAKLPIDLARLAGAEVARQRGLAEARSHQLSFTVETPLVILGNEMQLQRVVRNLLDNAIKFTPAGGQIRCMCDVRPGAPAEEPDAAALPAGAWAVVEIADNGIGIPADALPFLFERFYRVNAEGAVAGAGLGLPIARELVTLHGGWIDVTSTPGQGSTFTVYLPLAG